MALRNAFGNLALDATVQSVYTWLQARLGAKTTANSVSVNIASDQTVPVSAAALPLPTGAATATNQTTANSSLSSIDGKLPALSSGRVPVDVGTSINVGEVEIKNDTGNPVPVSAASLPLPSGAATAANQTTIIGHVDGLEASASSIDGKLPALSSGKVPVVGPLTDTELRATAVPISATSLPLPTGAATASNQTTANTSLASIAGLTIPAHDYISLSYTGTNLTSVVYKTGGSSGTTVATLTLAYTGSNLTSVTKS